MNDPPDLREVRAEAAELMADEAHDLIISLMGHTDFFVIEDKVKDYLHNWAATFRNAKPSTQGAMS